MYPSLVLRKPFHWVIHCATLNFGDLSENLIHMLKPSSTPCEMFFQHMPTTIHSL
ncbi:hypothetical protein DPMN_159891 [Dreissena polymorpha]|uniref:Uncharacterized protein n=1 Tax=Dreissena polymorpha TaxID=45954 RepID=A0A9D4EQ18_DREPO|nr:hypothetical protein DPMN_159891 [Dreissena polymorpha]